MSVLWLVLVAVPCAEPAAAQLSPERQQTACQLAERPAPPDGPGEAAALSEVYRRPGFERAHHVEAGDWAGLLARLRARLMALFETSGAQQYSSATRVVVLTGALVAVALALLRVRARRSAARAAAQKATVARGAPLALEAPPAHLARATQLLDSAPRAALREALFGLLSWLEARKLARPDRVKTNRELGEELIARGADQGVVAQVRPLLEEYDLTYYSLGAVTPAQARRYLAAVEPLVRREDAP